MSVTVPIRKQLRRGLAMAAVVVWIAGSAAARADDCTAMQAGLDKARQEMLAAEKEMTSYSQLINQTRRERDHWDRRIGELGREEGSFLAELSRPDRDPKDDASLKAKIDKTRSELWRSKNEMAKLNSLISGAYGQELEGFLEASTARHQRAILSQDSYRRQMDNDRCATRLRPAAAPPSNQRPTPSGTEQATVPPADLPPLPSPPTEVIQPPAPAPDQKTTTTTAADLPPLPASPPDPSTLPPPRSQAAAVDPLPPLPPLPPIDDFVIPPRPSSLTQPPIVEPLPPVAGLPPLPPPPSIASAPPVGTEIIRAPVIRAPNVGAPPIVIPNISAPPIRAPVVRAPPINIPQVHAPRVRAPVVRAPAIHAPRIQAPNIRARSTPRVVYTQPRRPDFSGLAARARAIGSIGRVPAPTGRRWGR